MTTPYYLGQSEFEDRILDLVDHAAEITQSDLQAIVTVLVRQMMEAKPIEDKRFK